jgi:hypothetical protein
MRQGKKPLGEHAQEFTKLAAVASHTLSKHTINKVFLDSISCGQTRRCIATLLDLPLQRLVVKALEAHRACNPTGATPSNDQGPRQNPNRAPCTTCGWYKNKLDACPRCPTRSGTAPTTTHRPPTNAPRPSNFNQPRYPRAQETYVQEGKYGAEYSDDEDAGCYQAATVQHGDTTWSAQPAEEARYARDF